MSRVTVGHAQVLAHHIVAAASGDALTLAGVNGAILAIAIAAISGYVLLVFQSFDQMETNLIEHANRIDDVTYLFSSKIGSLDPGGLGINELVDVIGVLASEGAGVAGWNLPRPSERADRGKVAMTVLSEISRRYPFSDEQSQKRELTTSLGVTNWHRVLQRAVDRLLGEFLMDDKGVLGELVVAAEHTIAGSVPGESFAGFRRWVAHCEVVAARLDEDINALERYRKRRMPSRLTPALGVLLFAATFICGVALPMVWSGVPQVLSAWVPACLYTCSLAAIVVVLVRHLSTTSKLQDKKVADP